MKNIETITTKLAVDDGLIDQANGTMKDISRASDEFATAANSFGSLSANADKELTSISGA